MPATRYNSYVLSTQATCSQDSRHTATDRAQMGPLFQRLRCASESHPSFGMRAMLELRISMTVAALGCRVDRQPVSSLHITLALHSRGPRSSCRVQEHSSSLSALQKIQRSCAKFAAPRQAHRGNSFNNGQLICHILFACIYVYDQLTKLPGCTTKHSSVYERMHPQVNAARPDDTSDSLEHACHKLARVLACIHSSLTHKNPGSMHHKAKHACYTSCTAHCRMGIISLCISTIFYGTISIYRGYSVDSI